MNKKIIINILSLFLLISCTLNNRNQSKTGYLVDINDLENISLPISKISNEINYIYLNDDQLISEILEIKEGGNFYFIHDYNQGILKYTNSGEFVKRIGSIGNGPSEYNMLSFSFDISNDKDEIYVLSNKKLIVFDFDGNLLRELNIESEYPINNIYYLYPDKLVGLAHNAYGIAPFNWITIDLNGKRIETKKNFIHFENENYEGLIPSMISYKFENKVYYFDQFNDTIFQISSDIVEPRFILNPGSTRITPKVFDEGGLGNTSKFYIPNTMLQFSNYLFISYKYKKEQKQTLFDTDNNKFYLLNSENVGMKNDLDSGPDFVPRACLNKNIVVDWINAFELKTYTASDVFKNSIPKYPEKKKQLVQLANSLYENDNPVLMLVKLKE